MRPPTSHFGNDITNTTNNNGNGNNNNDNNNNNNERSDLIHRIAEMGDTPVLKAGRGIIKVVHRCEDAKENSSLGE